MDNGGPLTLILGSVGPGCGGLEVPGGQESGCRCLQWRGWCSEFNLAVAPVTITLSK